tara:strand:- start:1926 stop:2063 length:138 start_codon:yes stop_codon:yes gene_type:complete
MELSDVEINSEGLLVGDENIFGISSLITGVVKFNGINKLIFSFKR